MPSSSFSLCSCMRKMFPARCWICFAIAAHRFGFWRRRHPPPSPSHRAVRPSLSSGLCCKSTRTDQSSRSTPIRVATLRVSQPSDPRRQPPESGSPCVVPRSRVNPTRSHLYPAPKRNACRTASPPPASRRRVPRSVPAIARVENATCTPSSTRIRSIRITLSRRTWPRCNRATPLCVNSRLLLQAEPTLAFKSSRLQPSSRADSSLQAEPIPTFLAEPIRLCLSRQPAPVLCTYFGSLDLLNCRVKDSSSKDHLLVTRSRPIRVVPTWVSFGITTYLGLRSPTGPLVWHGYRYESSDSTESSQPDYLSVSSGFATDQYVLGAPSGHRRPDSVSTRAHVARVQERASYWVGAEVRARASWRTTRSDRGEP
ncbi:hypothetical protein E5676_scaffold436G00450 [Cucumis melo var. makuwa]|uniref:Uncharacterized protein n=1 Tax=Cucumis melo var. makuwa TaxID=1194695 RepID=A0A5D3DQ87_CUCMM|nr:hypothetical protein E5676_scaffold436G00450 [Cucumis melo var. makuwa]